MRGGRSRWASRSPADIYWQAMMCVAAIEREGGRETGRINANANCGKCSRKERNTIMCAAYEAASSTPIPPHSHLHDLSLIVRLIEAQIHLRT